MQWYELKACSGLAVKSVWAAVDPPEFKESREFKENGVISESLLTLTLPYSLLQNMTLKVYNQLWVGSHISDAFFFCLKSRIKEVTSCLSRKEN